jgi:uracil phosphoribosyltransferase
MFRNRKSAMPIQYYNRLPKDKVSDVTFVLDPLIATCTCSPMRK